MAIEKFIDGSLTERVRELSFEYEIGSAEHKLMMHILMVLEGYIMIDKNGELWRACRHTKRQFRVACQCVECGQLVPTSLAVPGYTGHVVPTGAV